MHKWVPREIQFIERNIAGRSYADMTELFNKHFNLSFTEGQIKGVLSHYKLCNGRGRGYPGSDHITWCKGIHKFFGPKSVQFKKGYTPWNARPIGSERLKKEWIEIKVSRNQWRMKHVVIWEESNGPIPKGYVVIFADHNRQNFSLDNLLLVSRKELAV